MIAIGNYKKGSTFVCTSKIKKMKTDTTNHYFIYNFLINAASSVRTIFFYKIGADDDSIEVLEE